MLKDIKKSLYDLLVSLGYNVTDNGFYEENFPWLMLRTSQNSIIQLRGVSVRQITFTLDIFSSYQGEKEIIEIADNIAEHLPKIYGLNPEILYLNQSNMKILDDKNTGLVKKHGIIIYHVLVGATQEEESNENNLTSEY